MGFGASSIKKMDDQQQDIKILPMEEKLKECEQKCEENLNGWKRAAADLINYKKEEFARAQELMLYTKERFLESLLPMLDNFNLTEKNMPPELLEDANVKGLMMVKTQLEDFLKNSGVEAIDSLGKNFDPALHEVIQAVEAEGKESGTVVEEAVKGYMVNGRLLRPAKVKVVK